MRKILSLIFILICFSGLSQVVTYPKNLPTVKSDSGWYKIGYVQPTVLGFIVLGDTAIRPSQNGALRLWYHAGVDTAVWTWKDPRWTKISSTATNGSINWGQILGDIYNQTDLINLIDSFFTAGIATDTMNLSYRIDTIGSKVIRVIYPLVATQISQDTTELYYDSTNLNQYLTGVDTLNLSYRIDSISGQMNPCPSAFENGWPPLVSWIDSLKFGVTAGKYNIACTGPYTNNVDSVTLAAADPTLNRIDVIYVDINGLVGVITGDPATNPSAPQVDPDTQLELTTVYIPAASTVPSGTTITTVYDEGVGSPTEFNMSNSGALTVNFLNTSAVYHLTKSADVSAWTTGTKTITATSGSSLVSTDYSLLKFFISLKLPLASTTNISVQFFNGATAVTSPVVLTTVFGFSKTAAGYQNVTIPFSGVAFTSTTFNKIVFTLAGVGGGFYLDYVQLQGGIPNGNTNYVTNVYRTPGSTQVYQVINGVAVPAFTDSVGTGGGGGTTKYVTNGFATTVDSATTNVYKVNVDTANASILSRQRAAATYALLTTSFTLNGVTYSLATGGTWSVGTLTSVALAAPSIFTVTGSPVTASGTLTFAPNNAQGDLIYGSATNTLSYLNKSTTANSFLKNSGTSNNPAWAVITASDIGSGAALTKTDDTNVTLSLGGSPTTALLAATSMTLGWTGVLGVSRGGTSYGTYTTGDMLYASGSGTLSKLSIGTTGQKLVVVGGVPVWRDTAATASFTPAAMTKVDDTNVTLTLGGTPATSLLQATSLILGWTGVLSIARGGTNNGSLSVTNGGMAYFDGTKMVALPIGTAAQHLVVVGGIPAWRDTAAVVGSSGWSTTGNAGMTAATNFIGTTDAVSFRTRTNNTLRTIIDSVGLVGINTAVPTSQLYVTQATGNAPTFGAEVLSNANWTATNWTGTWSTGYTHTTGNTTALTRTGAATIATAYRIGFTVTGRTAGTFTVTYGGVTTAVYSATGQEAIVTTTTGTLSVTPTSTFDGTILLTITTITGTSTPVQTWADANGNTLNLRTDTLGNFSLGTTAMSKSIHGLNNIAIGGTALANNISGMNNMAMGNGTLTANTSGQGNLAFGSWVNAALVTEAALGANTTGSFNTAFGGGGSTSASPALKANTTGGNNTAFGNAALAGNTTGSNNTGIGVRALQTNSTNGGNTGIGYFALRTYAGSNSTAVGAQALQAATGVGNAAFGEHAGFSVSTGTHNLLGGDNTAFSNSGIFTGNYNTVWGESGLGIPASATTANVNNNTLVGYSALYTTGGAENNTIIGARGANGTSTDDISGDNNIAIGAGSRLPSTSSNDQITFWVNAGTTITASPLNGYNALTRFTGGQWLLNNTTSAVTSAPNTSAALEINGTTGGIIFPRLTTTQKNALTAAEGMVVYDITLHKLSVYTGSAWETVQSL